VMKFPSPRWPSVSVSTKEYSSFTCVIDNHFLVYRSKHSHYKEIRNVKSSWLFILVEVLVIWLPNANCEFWIIIVYSPPYNVSCQVHVDFMIIAAVLCKLFVCVCYIHMQQSFCRRKDAILFWIKGASIAYHHRKALCICSYICVYRVILYYMYKV
jgi:hypothetical protein